MWFLLRYFSPLAALLLAGACAGVEPVKPVRTGQTIGADGVVVVYEDRNSRGPGPVLVLVHGWNCDRRYWRAQLDTLATDSRVIAIDLGGHGESGSDRRDWSIPAFGRDVAAVVEHLDLRNAVLVGHSMGGPVVLEAAPLLAGRVLGVVGVDTLQDADAPPPPDLEARLEAFRQDFRGSVTALMPYFFTEEADPALRDWVAADMAAAPPAVALPALESLARYDGAAAIARLSVPAAVINADRIPTDADALRAARPGFDVEILTGTGHFLMMEVPEAFNAALRRIVDRWGSIAGE